MIQPDRHNTTAGFAQTVDQLSALVSRKAAPAIGELTRGRGLGVTAADAAMSSAQLARMGCSDVMSPQQYQSMPSVDELKGKWKQHVGAAKIAWGELTEDELLTSEGHRQKLAGLVQQRYAITRDEADRQVKQFFEKHRI
jgi:uncharacterized protein YjbJ (UPF0337 family)